MDAISVLVWSITPKPLLPVKFGVNGYTVSSSYLLQPCASFRAFSFERGRGSRFELRSVRIEVENKYRQQSLFLVLTGFSRLVLAAVLSEISISTPILFDGDNLCRFL